MTMKAIACLLALTASAAADSTPGTPPPPGPPRLALPSSQPARRKPANLAYPPAALSLFVDALILDKAGELGDAVRAYKRSLDASPQPNTYFNLADVERRRENYRDAIKAYEQYLAAAPDARDRKDVERAIAELRTTPFVAVLDGEVPDGVVLVDGVLIGPSPVVIQLAPGRHHVDRITPEGYRGTLVEAKPGAQEHVQMNPNDEEPNLGNVVLVGSTAITSQGGWRDPETGFEWRLPARFALEPGHYETVLWEPGRACDKIRFDVPRTKSLVYVYLDAKPAAKPGGCLPLKVRTQLLEVRP